MNTKKLEVVMIQFVLKVIRIFADIVLAVSTPGFQPGRASSNLVICTKGILARCGESSLPMRVVSYD